MAFRIVDFDDGTFQLKVAGDFYKWQITKTAKPGLGILFRTDEDLPGNQEEAEKFENSHSDAEIQKMYNKLERQAYKNILALNSLVTPLDTAPIPGLSQLEFFSLCLEDNDPAKVYAFFLIFSANTTKLREEIKSRLKEIIEKNPEMAPDLNQMKEQANIPS